MNWDAVSSETHVIEQKITDRILHQNQNTDIAINILGTTASDTIVHSKKFLGFLNYSLGWYEWPSPYV